MSRHSAEVEWIELPRFPFSLYCRKRVKNIPDFILLRDKRENAKIHPLFIPKTKYRDVIVLGRNWALSTIIHEINELELTYIFEKLGLDPNAEIYITKQHKQIFKEELKDYAEGEPALITHLISPYGLNCLLPRKIIRARW